MEDIRLLNIIYHKKEELYEETIQDCLCSNNEGSISHYIERFAQIDVILDEILSEFYDWQREEQERKEVKDDV